MEQLSTEEDKLARGLPHNTGEIDMTPKNGGLKPLGTFQER